MALAYEKIKAENNLLLTVPAPPVNGCLFSLLSVAAWESWES